MHDDHQPRVCRSTRSAPILSLILFIVGLVACGQPEQVMHRAPLGSVDRLTRTVTLPSDAALPTFSPENLTAIAEKEADLQAERDYHATAHALPPAPVDELFPTDEPRPTEVIPTGVQPFETCGGIREHPPFWVNNCWYNVTDTLFTNVQAGESLEEPAPGMWGQGGLFVYADTLTFDDPHDSPIYWSPARVGDLTITRVDDDRVTLHAANGTTYIFNLTTRTYEHTIDPPVVTPPPSDPPARLTPTATTAAAGCVLYPIALHESTVTDRAVGDEVKRVELGSGRGHFGWLAWTGDQSIMALTDALTPPGTSALYSNPRDGGDRSLSVDDWVRGRPGVGQSRDVRDAVDALRNETITVPLWDIVTGEGRHLQYHIVGFAQIQLTNDQLAGKNWLSFRYVGDVTCQ